MRIDFASSTAVVVLSLWLVHEVQCRWCQQCGDSKYKECIDGEVEPTECEESQAFCATYAVAIDKDAGPYIARSCSSFNGTKCSWDSLIDGRSVVICRKSCETDGCNKGEWKIPLGKNPSLE